MDEDKQAVDALKEVALESLKERRRSRRWKIFFSFFWALMALAVFGLMAGKNEQDLVMTGDITAAVDINGIIMAEAPASATLLVPALQKAFGHEKTKGVLLRINSPGGSPVQAGQVYDEIIRLKKKYPDKKVYATVSDLCASGGYYIAAAADEIYVDKASIVGSIGVRMDSFGAVGAMQKLGIERRLYTSGANKGMLDPFLPEVPNEVSHIESLLTATHQQFIAAVKQGRGDKLADNPDLFSGLFWNGEQAVQLGLVDGLGSADYVARELIGAKEIKNFSMRKDFLQSLGEQLGASIKVWFSEQAVPMLR